MFTECRQFLIDRLKESGIRMEPITSMKKLRIYGDSHVGAVLFDEEDLSRNGSKRIYEDQSGVNRKRQKVFDRNIRFSVIIGEYQADRAEQIYETFLSKLRQGLMVDGNYISVEPVKTDWVESDDSILKAKMGVRVQVECSGGVYIETVLTDIQEKQLDIQVN